MSPAEWAIASKRNGHFIFVVFQVPWELLVSTSDFGRGAGEWGDTTSEEGIDVEEAGVDCLASDWQHSVLQMTEEPGVCRSILVRWCGPC